MTTDALESYLSGEFHRDREDIFAIERVLRETGETVAETFRKETADWPYERGAQEATASGEPRFSQSTSAMMVHAIDLLLGGERSRQRPTPYPFELDKGLAERLRDQRGNARTALAANLKSERRKGATTVSGTFGVNDPITLSFLAEVESAGADLALPGNYIRATTTKLLKLDPSSDAKFFKFEDGQGRKPLANAFVPLRVVAAAATLGQSPQGNSEYLRYFLSTLHDQLSFSSIPDSRFDPAELIFCLEGVLSIAPQSIDEPLFERILDVLAAAQRTSAHWRPTKPFLRDQRGMALFPVSVEAANSLLRSCALLDANEQFHRYSEKYIGLFRRFWEWLSARRVQLTENIRGWHSDHVSDPESIQLWDTAQVVGFLLGYRRRLYTHISRTTLRLARFQVRRPEKPKMPWSQETRERQEASGTLTPRASEGAEEPEVTIRTSFEPVTSLGNAFATYGKIEKSFLDGWLDGAPDAFSMLLYGPPGTGKTTVAENLADALQFPMITITVSDFLAGGGGAVEARAKMIFDVLEAQSNCVILFDEIDELVLDRSSPRHANQDTVFKFMTPGMLTKLNNLRRARRSIFIMATNYAYRIDPAIRRTGRIDENYLLLPPDAAARTSMLKGFLKKAPKGSRLTPDTVSAEDWSALSNASFFLGYKDIEAAVSRALQEDPEKQNLATLERLLLEWGRTTTLQLYRAAFCETDDSNAIAREFLPLVRMADLEGSRLAEHDSSQNHESLTEGWQNRSGNSVVSGGELKELAAEHVRKENLEGPAIRPGTAPTAKGNGNGETV